MKNLKKKTKILRMEKDRPNVSEVMSHEEVIG